MKTMEGRSAIRYGHIHFLLFIYFSTLCFRAGAVINSVDLSALNSLSKAWSGNHLSWTTGDPCSTPWQGIICDPTNTSVISLDLSSMGISGTLPSAIGSLSKLTTLELSFNGNLGGSLPVELGQLAALQTLSIQSCSFTGNIPDSLGDLTNLTFIALNGNNLTGPIPSSIGFLTKLYWFDLSENHLTGELPVSTTSTTKVGLDSLPSIVHIHLNNNSITGSIPSELGGGSQGVLLNKVIHLLLDNNQFNGTIPDSLGNLTSLEILNVANNQLVGPIPATLSKIVPSGSVTGLQQLHVANNMLTGMIPNLAAVTGLQVLDLSNNQFSTQAFPSWLSNATSLQSLFMDGARLAGPLPTAILGSQSLQTFYASNNSINNTLTIPAPAGPNLTLVSLQNNDISFLNQVDPNANISAIELSLEGNPVCAETNIVRPTTACGTTATIQPWSSPLTRSTKCASTPDCSGNLVLNLQNPNNCNCAQPLRVTFEVRQPSFFVITDSEIESLRTQLYPQLGLLDQQVWTYSAYYTPGTEGTRRLDVIIYIFPADGSVSLSESIRSNISSALTQQKVTITGFMPYKADVYILASEATSKKTLSAGAISGIVIGGLFVILAVGAYAYLQKRRADKLKKREDPFASWGGGVEDGAAPKIQGAKFFTFSEIKKATDNFSESNEIGVGGYGKVYKGVLPSGELVAVKRAQEGSMQGANEFKTEIEILSRVHHKNLVGLVGYCYDQGEQMLVYEFMVNGTMREWLAGKKAFPLDWSKRLSIAVGSARGLSYLHDLANPPILHQDIKSSNILLDENHVAKVADFGLSQLAPEGADKLQLATQVKGTLGYLDPEYYMTQQFSDKSDVYSFGVVLLELLTSHQPIEHGKYIVREVKTALDKAGMAALQPMLDPLVQVVPLQDVEKFLDLALRCVEEKGVNRPTMNEVVKELEALTANSNLKTQAIVNSEKPWTDDKYEDDIMPDNVTGSFQYSGGYRPQHPEPK